MSGMMVKGRDYRFTTFQARESSLVAERAAFPVKMLQEIEGVPNIARISPVREAAANEFVPLKLLFLY